MKRLLYIALVALVSCSSPERDGRAAAKADNNCSETFIESVQKLETEFVSTFNPSKYVWRSDAIMAYNKEFKTLVDNYQRELDKSAISKSKLKGKYANSYKDLDIFEASFEEEKDTELSLLAQKLMSSETIPEAVKASINEIVPPKPDENRIKTDLNGHSLSEGFEKNDCYFSEQWRRTIGEQVEIKEMQIEEITCDDCHDYSFIATMVLQERYLSYTARVQVYYVLPDGEDWKIDFVKSLGIRLIQTDKYTDCIRCSIEDDGWGGIDALFITNTSEVQLLVIGHFVANKGTRNFSQVIPPGEKKQVGGLFGGGSVTSFEIIAVERES